MTSAPEHFKKKLGAGFLHCLVFGIARIGSSGNTQQDGSLAQVTPAWGRLPESYGIELSGKSVSIILSEINL
jgi:hypothetical protein